MRFLTYGVSVIGPGHIATGLPNQDAIFLRSSKKSWLAVLSDGMGSRPHAHIGSTLACQAAFSITQDLDFSTPDRILIERIYQRWLKMLGDISPNDAVATFLMAWGLPNGECRLFQLGDGAVLYHQDETAQLVNQSDASFSNETTGLGLSKKWSDWHCKKVRLKKSGQGVVLMSDGISDDIDNLLIFTPALFESLKGKSKRHAKRWITRELDAWPTPKHTDDKSIAVIYRT